MHLLARGPVGHVAVAIQGAFRGDPALAPRDEGKLVAALHELPLAANAKISDDEAWSYLGSTRHWSALRDVAP